MDSLFFPNSMVLKHKAVIFCGLHVLQATTSKIELFISKIAFIQSITTSHLSTSPIYFITGK